MKDNIATFVSTTLVVGEGNKRKVYVVANTGSVKNFNQSVVAKSTVRRTKRWAAERDIGNALKDWVRYVVKLTAKHVKDIMVVVPTDKPNMYRDVAGRFVKIENAVEL
jgi:hypothetical protein